MSHLGTDLSRMLQQLPPPVAMKNRPADSIPQLRASNQKQHTLSLHTPQLQQPGKQSTAPALHPTAMQAMSMRTPQVQQLVRPSGVGLQEQAALNPFLGASHHPQRTGIVVSSGNGTRMQGRMALSPFLGGSSPHTQQGAVPSFNSTSAGTSSQMQKPTFANHKRPGPQLQPNRPLAAKAATTALKARYVQHARSDLPLRPHSILTKDLCNKFLSMDPAYPEVVLLWSKQVSVWHWSPRQNSVCFLFSCSLFCAESKDGSDDGRWQSSAAPSVR